MTIYEFLSKFIGEYVKIMHTIPNHKRETIYSGFIYDFFYKYSSNDRISKSRYFNAIITNDSKLYIEFQYNREVIK